MSTFLDLNVNVYVIDPSPLGFSRPQWNKQFKLTRRVRIPTGRGQTSWLCTSVAEELNQGLPGTNPAGGQSGTWTLTSLPGPLPRLLGGPTSSWQRGCLNSGSQIFESDLTTGPRFLNSQFLLRFSDFVQVCFFVLLTRANLWKTQSWSKTKKIERRLYTFLLPTERT